MRFVPPNSSNGLTRMEVLITLAVLALVVLWVIAPSITKSHTPARRITCIHHLKEVGVGFRQWSDDGMKAAFLQTDPDNATTDFQSLSNYEKEPAILY
jgi:hypothetical protein